VKEDVQNFPWKTGEKEERKQRDQAMTEYLALHPELRLGYEEKITLENSKQFQKGFEEYPKRKLSSKQGPNNSGARTTQST
jgi:hypothetical protein